MRRPNDSWKALRDLIGGPAALFPGNFPMLAATLLGLPATTAGLISEDLPLWGALSEKSDDQLSLVLGLHVRSGPELVASLTTGQKAQFIAKKDDKSGVVLLEPKPGKPRELKLGVVGNTLLVSKHEGEVQRVGPYVARTLTKRSAPAEPMVLNVEKAALKGTVAGRMRKLWGKYQRELEQKDQQNRELHGGKTPDFGDPAAALLGVGGVVNSLAEMLEQSQRVKVVIEPQDDRVDVRAELWPEANGSAADAINGLSVGDLAPLLVLPKDSALAIASRSTATSRAESAKSMLAGVNKLFQDRLGDGDRKRLEDTLSGLAASRGDQLAYAGLIRNGEISVVMRTPAADQKAFDEAASDAFQLLNVRAFADPLRQFVGHVAVRRSSKKVDGLDAKAQLALVTLKPNPPSAGAPPDADLKPKQIEFLWAVHDGMAFGAAAKQAGPVLSQFVAAGSSDTLRADPLVLSASERASKSVAFALLVQPLRLSTGEGASAPVLLTMGRRDRVGELRVELSQAALRGVVRFVAQ